MGYAGLAAVLYEDPARRDEALALLDRARKLDPLQPAYDVTKAIFLSYEQGDVQGAADLLADVLRRNPDYQPALARMSELRSQLLGQTAAGIEYGERALISIPCQRERVECWSGRILMSVTSWRRSRSSMKRIMSFPFAACRS